MLVGLETVKSWWKSLEYENGERVSSKDISLVRRILKVPRDMWTDRMEEAAVRILLAYRGRLEMEGVSLDDLRHENLEIVPADLEEVENVLSQSAQYKYYSLDNNKIVLESHSLADGVERYYFLLKFEFSEERVSKLKRLCSNCVYDRRIWEIPAISKNFDGVWDFAESCGIHLSAKVIDFLYLAVSGRIFCPVGRIYVEDSRVVFKFEYDEKIVKAVKGIYGSIYDRGVKVWRVSVSQKVVGAIQGFISQWGDSFLIDSEVYDLLDGTVKQAERVRESSRATDIGNEVLSIDGIGGELRPFQEAGVKYAMGVGKCFFADEMGLGKTVQALATLQVKKYFPALVVCPASLRLNWKREAEKWLPGRRVEFWGDLAGGRRLYDDFADLGEVSADIYIINYEGLGKNKEDLIRKKFKAVVFDESHYLKNPKAQRTEAAREIVKGMSHGVYMLTGTPVLSRPKELLSQLEVMGGVLPKLGVRNSWDFLQRYCGAKKKGYGWDFSGSTNVEELNKYLRESCYIRRLKADVLQDLPSKQRVVVPFSINRKVYDLKKQAFVEYFASQIMRDKAFYASLSSVADLEEKQRRLSEYHKNQSSLSVEHISEIEKLKQIAVDEKLDGVMAWIDNFLESGQKLVIFAHHQNVVRKIAEYFNAPYIDGEVSVEERQLRVDMFQGSEQVPLIVLSIKTGGVGLTLTAASNVAFVELGWTPADMDQAEDRCHRIGQRDAVMAWYLLAEGTIEEDIFNLIEKKREVVSAVTEGEGSSVRSESVLSELMKKFASRA